MTNYRKHTLSTAILIMSALLLSACYNLVRTTKPIECIDALEPNDGTGSVSTLATVGSNSTITYPNFTIFPLGDNDFYQINATETDSSCQACDFLGTDEDYQLSIALTAPQGAGSYQLCTGRSIGGVNDFCVEVLAGQNRNFTYTFDGSCASVDNYSVFLRIFGDNLPDFQCAPYVLTYNFIPGCF